jgi:Tol biopolymer transport system component
LLYRTDRIIAASDWSRDGNFLLFWQQDGPRASDDLMALPLAGQRKPFPVENSGFNEKHGQFSPNGRWVVYASDQSGIRELYARQFLPPELGATTTAKKVQITSGGGTQPRWRADGRELFYVSADG